MSHRIGSARLLFSSKRDPDVYSRLEPAGGSRKNGANVLSFLMKGRAALACYYVKANWPRPATAPTIQTSGPHLSLTFVCDSQMVRDLQDTLSKAMLLDIAMVRSARMMRMALAFQVAGKVIPPAGIRDDFGSAPSATG